MNEKTVPFNSPFELGIRMLYILMSAYPTTFDLQQLVFLDYATIYSGDLDGPESLHTPVPLRGSEYTTRREIIEQGLYLMSTRGFVSVLIGDNGVEYQAGENASAMMGIIGGSYAKKLIKRCAWVSEIFGHKNAIELQNQFTQQGLRWGAEFVLPSKANTED